MKNKEAVDKLIARVSSIKNHPKIALAKDIEEMLAFAMEFHLEKTHGNTERNPPGGRGIPLKDLIKVHVSEIMAKKAGQIQIHVSEIKTLFLGCLNSTDINDSDQSNKLTKNGELKSQKEGSRDDKTKDAHAGETKFQSTRKRASELCNEIENSKKQRTIKVIDNLRTQSKTFQKKNNKLAHIRKSLTPNNRFNTGSRQVVQALEAIRSSHKVTTKTAIAERKHESRKKEIQKPVQQSVTKESSSRGYNGSVHRNKNEVTNIDNTIDAHKFSLPVDHKETEDVDDDFAIELDIMLQECQNKEDRSKNAKQLESRKQSTCGRGKVLRTLIDALKPKQIYKSLIPQEKPKLDSMTEKEQKSDVRKDSNDDDDKGFCGLDVLPLDDLELAHIMNTTAVVDLNTYLDDVNDWDNVDKHTRSDALKSQNEESINQDTHKEDSAKKERKKRDQQSVTKEAHSCGHNRPSHIVMEKRNIYIREKDDKNTTKKEMTKAEDANSIDAKFESSLKRIREAYNSADNVKKQRTVQIIDYLPTDNDIACHKKQNMRAAGKSFYYPRIIRQH